MVTLVTRRAITATTRKAMKAAFVEFVFFLAMELTARVRMYVINKAPRSSAISAVL
jgi:hypothetical protein